MDSKKDLTKQLLADCFRELMQSTAFDKITIKMITDSAGLIRPTFYKHFQDKYEILEWIFRTDIAAKVDLLIENRMETDAVVMFCRCLDQDRRFYRRAYQMEPGPNSFESILSGYIRKWFLKATEQSEPRFIRNYPSFTRETVVLFYTNGFTSAIRDWFFSDSQVSAEDLAAFLTHLLTHSFTDLFDSNTPPGTHT